MLALSLAGVLMFAPPREPADEAPPPADNLPPYWRTAPPPVPESWPEPPKPPPVPSTGTGLLVLSGEALGAGSLMGGIAIGLTLADDPHTRTSRDLAAIASAPLLGTGLVLLTLGLVVRAQYRARGPHFGPDAPPLGNGMLLGGIGLLVGGTGFAAQAISDLITEECTGSGCFDVRPIGAPIQLAAGIASMAIGSGLLVVGVKRRLNYRDWMRSRANLQPRLQVGRQGLMFGISGRF